MNNAQFFFTAGTAITFGSVPSITVINGGTTCNIFWLAGSAISFTGTSPPTGIPGILIAGTSVSFASGINVSGRIYAQTGSVTFIGNSLVNGLCTTYSNICFLGNTPITTDQGIVQIKDIDTKIHTISNSKILAITETISTDNYLVCFEKNSIMNNYPNEKTIMSKDHKISYNGIMIEAHKFVGQFENVRKVKYNGRSIIQYFNEKT